MICIDICSSFFDVCTIHSITVYHVKSTIHRRTSYGRVAVPFFSVLISYWTILAIKNFDISSQIE
jgi:hypothetical protein